MKFCTSHGRNELQDCCYLSLIILFISPFYASSDQIVSASFVFVFVNNTRKCLT